MTVCTHGSFIVLPPWEARLPTRPHFPDPEPTSLCPILIMLRAWFGSDKYQFLSHWFDSTWVSTHEVPIPRSPKTGDGRSTFSPIPFGQLFGPLAHTTKSIHICTYTHYVDMYTYILMYIFAYRYISIHNAYTHNT